MPHRILIIVLDGLRPEQVSQRTTPAIAAVARRGVTFANHHCCFPSVTRTNSASLATGCHPGVHGLVDNELHLPAVRPDGPVNTGDFRQLEEVDRASGGRLLDAPSLSEIFGRSGRGVAMASSCSTGSCLLQNHRRCGFTCNTGLILPVDRTEMIRSRFGPVPAEGKPNTGRNAYAAAVMTDYILPELAPELAIVWLSDPDHTQHSLGIGSAESLRAVREVDGMIGRILGALERLGRADETDVFVLSDHGYISYDRSEVALRADMVAAGLKEAPGSDDVKVIGAGVYLHPDRKDLLPGIVRFLQRHRAVGSIFTRRPVEGSLPISLVAGEHKRTPDILFARRWSDEPNEFGFAGISPGGIAASHGGSSPWEMRPVMVAAGPGIRSGIVTDVPSGNIDLLPTALALAGLESAFTPSGRVLTEALADTPASPPAATVQTHTAESALPTGHYRQSAQLATVGNTFYLLHAGGGFESP